MHSSKPRGLAGAVVVVATSLALYVAAQGPGTPNALIPYQGRLDENGAPVDGTVDLRVGLFTSAGASTACLEGANLTGCGIWAAEFPAVAVSAGRFAITLGSTTALPNALFESGALHLGIAVRRDADPFVALAGLQRLASVPFAVRGDTATDLFVADTVGVRTASPEAALHVDVGELRVRASDDDLATDIAAFVAENETRGVGISWNGVRAIGTSPDADLHLDPKGTGGRVRASALKNTNGTVTRYMTDVDRYLVEATIQIANPANSVRGYVAIPDAVMTSMCGDEDGCTIRIGMKQWEGPGGSVGSRTMTSMGPIHFFVGEVVGGQRAWRRSLQTATNENPGSQVFGAQTAIDGNAAIDHIMRDHDCYFTDATYPVGTGATVDNTLGFGLLNWLGNYSGPTCVLIIDD